MKVMSENRTFGMRSMEIARDSLLRLIIGISDITLESRGKGFNRRNLQILMDTKEYESFHNSD